MLCTVMLYCKDPRSDSTYASCAFFLHYFLFLDDTCFLSSFSCFSPRIVHSLSVCVFSVSVHATSYVISSMNWRIYSLNRFLFSFIFVVDEQYYLH